MAYRVGDTARFVVAVLDGMQALVGQPVLIVRAGVRAGDALGEDANGRQLVAQFDVDYMIETWGGMHRALVHGWQLAPMHQPPEPPGLTRAPVPA